MITIVIPVYNEGENIADTVWEINENVKTKHRILAVYDFAEDTTLPVLQKMMQEQANIALLRNKYGRGALNAIKSGLEEADGEAVLVVMADLSDDLSRVDEMFEKIKEGYDLVCGSRYMKGGQQIGGPWFKKALSRVAGVSLYYLAGLPTHDVTNSFKMYTPRVLQNIEIESSGGFELGMEIVVKAHKQGYRITEVPSVWRDRVAGESNFKLWAWLPSYLRWYFYACYRG